jgi:flagellin-like hook-associated protein FlgL
MRTFANYVKGFLTDIVTAANTDFNGHFLFAGTKTTKNSITPTGAQKDNMPFEIVQDVPSATNPSGLRVDFKGNNNDRVINKDGSTTEVLNTKSGDIFGYGGTAVLNDLVDLYNLLKYKSDGSERGDNDVFTPADSDKLNSLQKKITDSYDVVNRTAAQAGARQTRLESLNDQLVEEGTRLKGYLSNIKDTNYSEAAINLAKEQNTLQFALQAGTHIMHQSLFDFLK